MKPLVVLYYHRILPFEGYDIDIDTFKWQLSFLRKHFDIVSPDILFDLKEGKKLKRASVLITFDDGFVDNFVYAYPVLKQSHVKALIFVITSKINEKGIHKTLLDDSPNLFKPKPGESAFSDSLYNEDNSEFLSWEELKVMKDSGVFYIGSHSDSHVKVFASDNPIGKYDGNMRLHWSYEYALGRKPKKGDPIYPLKSSLATRRFFGNRWETQEEFEGRVKQDLLKSKQLIKKYLDVDTKFLSWPWGEYNEVSLRIAKDIGFEFCFDTRKQAFWGDDFCRIGRIHAPENKIAFVRKLLSNKYYLSAKIYGAFHK